MPLAYPVVIRHVLHRLVERFHSIDFRHSLTTICLFLFLSFFTSIIVNILLPILFIKNNFPSSSSSSSLSVLPSKHVFFPSDLTSLQCSSPKHHELQAHYHQQVSINSQRKYTQDPSKRKNISRGKNFIYSSSILSFVCFLFKIFDKKQKHLFI